MSSEPSVLFYDNHLLVLKKPPGLLTQPASSSDFSLEAWGKNWVKEKFQKPGNVFLHAVHRLDKPVGGIVLFARTSKALSRLQESIRNKKCVKKYLALVEGEITSPKGMLEHWIRHGSHEAFATTPQDPEGKRAILNFELTSQKSLCVEGKKCCWVSLELVTGRYHQIRLQMSLMGHPIVGDKRYGSSLTGINSTEIALWHTHLEIAHPVSGELLHWFLPQSEIIFHHFLAN